MDIKVVDFKKVVDERGSLTVAEYGKDIPFLVKRIYYITGVPKGEKRGFHSHKVIKEMCIPIKGSCEIMITNGMETTNIIMDDPAKGLYLGKDTWREISNFSEDAILLVLSSEEFREDDYIWNYDEFLSSVREEK